MPGNFNLTPQLLNMHRCCAHVTDRTAVKGEGTAQGKDAEAGTAYETSDSNGEKASTAAQPERKKVTLRLWGNESRKTEKGFKRLWFYTTSAHGVERITVAGKAARFAGSRLRPFPFVSICCHSCFLSRGALLPRRERFLCVF